MVPFPGGMSGCLHGVNGSPHHSIAAAVAVDCCLRVVNGSTHLPVHIEFAVEIVDTGRC